MARSDATRCLRSRRTRSGDVGDQRLPVERHHHRLVAARFLAAGQDREMLLPWRFRPVRQRVASCPATGKDTCCADPDHPGLRSRHRRCVRAAAGAGLAGTRRAGGHRGRRQCRTGSHAAERAGAGRVWPVATVPVYGGADRPLLGAFVNETRVHGVDGLGGIALPAGGAPAPGSPPTRSARILRDATRAGDAGRHRARDQSRAGADDRAGAGRASRADRADDRRLGRGQRHARRPSSTR